MKKIYLQPKLVIVSVNIKSAILEGSLTKFGSTVNGDRGGWARQDNSWNIWGGGDDEE